MVATNRSATLKPSPLWKVPVRPVSTMVTTGATVNVPLFVNEGDRIKVDTRTREYVSRA